MLLLHSFQAYCPIDPSKVIWNSLEVSNFNQLFLKLNRFIPSSVKILFVVCNVVSLCFWEAFEPFINMYYMCL
jgi:hypothetical protein